jgi:hypothetical protein
MTRKLRNNHILQEVPTRSLDIVARVHHNELQGRAKLILDKGYLKLIADNDKHTLDREAFNHLVSNTLIRNGKLPGGYDEHFVRHMAATAERYSKDMRRAVEDVFVAMKNSNSARNWSLNRAAP